MYSNYNTSGANSGLTNSTSTIPGLYTATGAMAQANMSYNPYGLNNNYMVNGTTLSSLSANTSYNYGNMPVNNGIGTLSSLNNSANGATENNGAANCSGE